MCLAQGPQGSDTGEAITRGPSVSSQALYHWATALPKTKNSFSDFIFSLSKDWLLAAELKILNPSPANMDESFQDYSWIQDFETHFP